MITLSSICTWPCWKPKTLNFLSFMIKWITIFSLKLSEFHIWHLDPWLTKGSMITPKAELKSLPCPDISVELGVQFYKHICCNFQSTSKTFLECKLLKVWTTLLIHSGPLQTFTECLICAYPVLRIGDREMNSAPSMSPILVEERRDAKRETAEHRDLDSHPSPLTYMRTLGKTLPILKKAIHIYRLLGNYRGQRVSQSLSHSEQFSFNSFYLNRSHQESNFQWKVS